MLSNPPCGRHGAASMFGYTLSLALEKLGSGLSGIGGEPMSFGSAEIAQTCILYCTQIEADQLSIESTATRDFGFSDSWILHQWWLKNRRALEDKAFGGIHHSVNDGALKELAASTQHHPAKAIQPAPGM